MITDKKVVFIWSPNHDPVKSHWAFLVNYASGFLQLGYQPVFLDHSKRDFANTIIKEARDHRTAFFVTIQGFGSSVVGTNEKGVTVNLFEFFKKPVINLCGDYPYYQWIHHALSDDHPYNIFLFLDTAIPDFINRQWPNHHFHCSTFECCTQDYWLSAKAPRKGFTKRRYSVVYSGNYRDPQQFRQIINQKMQPLLKAFDEVTDRLLKDMDTPPWKITQSILERHHEKVDIKNNENHRIFFWAVNQFVRFTRRKRLFTELKKIPICFVGTPPPSLQLHKKSKVIGNIRQKDNVKLYEEAKSVIMIPPNFPYGITERFLNTAARGAIPICPKTPGIEKYFKADKNYLEIEDPFTSLQENIYSIERNPEYFDEQRIDTLRIIDEHFRPYIIAQKLLAKIRDAGFEQ